jgi:hypothetical protein
MTAHVAMPALGVVLGFAPHSGWAALVVVGGSPARPEILERRRIEMADPKLQGSRQPYHEADGLELAEARRLLKRHADRAETLALAALRAVVRDLEARGHVAKEAVILQSSGRQGLPLESILASHALIHTADGDHFRSALAAAAGRLGLEASGVRERELVAQAETVLGSRGDALRDRVLALGKPLGPPWGADQKAATLAAWMALAERSRRR